MRPLIAEKVSHLPRAEAREMTLGCPAGKVLVVDDGQLLCGRTADLVVEHLHGVLLHIG
jgi:alpha-D-ribose 1-methylphosphonate 5-triphosphate diphosphatase PhnM